MLPRKKFNTSLKQKKKKYKNLKSLNFYLFFGTLQFLRGKRCQRILIPNCEANSLMAKSPGQSVEFLNL